MKWKVSEKVNDKYDKIFGDMIDSDIKQTGRTCILQRAS